LFTSIELDKYDAIALTATNATDPSWGTYCYPHDLVNDEHMYTCLADLFSNNWMEYIERNQNNLDALKLTDLFEDVRKRTLKHSRV
jgi:hypothetical protein